MNDKRENEKEHDFIILGETFIAVIEVKTPTNENNLDENLKKAVEQSQAAKQLIENVASTINQKITPNVFRFVAFPYHRTDALILKAGTLAYQMKTDNLKEYFIEQGSSHIALISMPEEAEKQDKVQKAKQAQLKSDHVMLICEDNLDFTKWWQTKTACPELPESHWMLQPFRRHLTLARYLLFNCLQYLSTTLKTRFKKAKLTTTDITMLHEILIAIWDMGSLEQKLPGEAKFELGNWIAKIDKQLKDGRITFERTNAKQKEDMRNQDIIETKDHPDFIFAFPKPDDPEFKINLFYDILHLNYLQRDQYEAFQDNDNNQIFFPLKGAAGTGKTLVLLAKLFRFVLQDEKNKAFFVHNTEKYAFSDDYNTPVERAMLEFQKLTGITFCDYLKEIKAGCEFDETCRHQIFLMIYPQQAEKKSYTSLDNVKD